MTTSALDRTTTILRGALANCGGMNFRTRRFAGALAAGRPSESDLLGILHSLILENGVRKTTSRGRNSAVLQRLVSDGRLGPPRRWRVLEVGASAGLDALSARPILEEHGGLARYVLGDACPFVLYDSERQLVFDEEGHLLQVRVPGGFVSMNFSYNFGFQRWTSLPKRIAPLALRARRFRLDRSRVARIPLVHPDIVADLGRVFELRRLDVFDPVLDATLDGAEFDLILCMHLLVPRYFDDVTIARGIGNLQRLLAPGGRLVVGATEAFRVIARDDDGSSVGDLP